MKTTFLGQGYETTSINAVGKHLINYLSDPNFHSFTGISAFASEAGVYGISGYIKSAKQTFQNLTLIVGVDQEGTSKEALQEILDLYIKSYIFYQVESPIFHPKIYLFEGENNIKLIVGSSNLTRRGLFSNVESSLLIEFDIYDKEGIALLTELKSYYQSLFDLSDPNLFKISEDIISDFMARGIVPDEATREKIYNRKNVNPDNPQSVSYVSNTLIPRRKTSSIPNSLFPSKPRKSKEASIERNNDSSIGDRTLSAKFSNSPLVNFLAGRLVWESNPLSQRDLNIPKGPNTNVTGSMLLSKGQLIWIDQRHYFRNEVFSSLPWANDGKPSKAHLERATAFFRIIIEGDDHGLFPLILTHNTKTNTETYRQKNSMTSLSWGKAKMFVAKENLIGKIARLYMGLSGESNEYTLTIE